MKKILLITSMVLLAVIIVIISFVAYHEYTTVRDYNKYEPVLGKAMLGPSCAEGLKALVPFVKSFPSVEDAWFEGMHLTIKIKHGGTIGYLCTPKPDPAMIEAFYKRRAQELGLAEGEKMDVRVEGSNVYLKALPSGLSVLLYAPNRNNASEKLTRINKDKTFPQGGFRIFSVLFDTGGYGPRVGPNIIPYRYFKYEIHENILFIAGNTLLEKIVLSSRREPVKDKRKEVFVFEEIVWGEDRKCTDCARTNTFFIQTTTQTGEWENDCTNDVRDKLRFREKSSICAENERNIVRPPIVKRESRFTAMYKYQNGVIKKVWTEADGQAAFEKLDKETDGK